MRHKHVWSLAQNAMRLEAIMEPTSSSSRNNGIIQCPATDANNLLRNEQLDHSGTDYGARRKDRGEKCRQHDGFMTSDQVVENRDAGSGRMINR